MANNQLRAESRFGVVSKSTYLGKFEERFCSYGSFEDTNKKRYSLEFYMRMHNKQICAENPFLLGQATRGVRGWKRVGVGWEGRKKKSSCERCSFVHPRVFST